MTHTTTPLILATMAGQANAVKIILNEADVIILNEADDKMKMINSVDSTGKTALTWAASEGNLELVKLLVEHGAGNATQRSSSLGAVGEAVRNGHTDCVEFLLDNGSVADTDHRSKLLTIAAEYGHLATLKALIHRGMDVNQPFFCESALVVAARNGQTECVELLLDNGAARRQDYMVDALVQAAQFGHLDIMKALMTYGRRGLEVDTVNIAVENGHVDCIKYLLEKGATVNKNTFVDALGKVQVLKLLLDHYHGDLNTALSYAIPFAIPFDAIELFLEKGCDVNTTSRLDKRTMLMTWNVDIESVELLLAHGADVNAADNNGKTALMYAADRGFDRGIKLLVDKGANVNAADNDGKTALMYAVERGLIIGLDIESVELLLAHGADVNAADNNGKTALMYAAHRGLDRGIKLLVDHGADVNAVDDYGWTAFVWYGMKNQKQVNELLKVNSTKRSMEEATSNLMSKKTKRSS